MLRPGEGELGVQEPLVGAEDLELRPEALGCLPGEPIAAAETTNLVLTPRGPRETRGGALHETSRAGIYHAGERAVGVSATEEADVLPGTVTRAPQVRPTRSYPPLSVLIAFGLLGLLVIEWALYHRGRLP